MFVKEGKENIPTLLSCPCEKINDAALQRYAQYSSRRNDKQDLKQEKECCILVETDNFLWAGLGLHSEKHKRNDFLVF